jgi:hypothetical protein
VINGDKREDGHLSEGDLFFDTAAGGLGAFIMVTCRSAARVALPSIAWSSSTAGRRSCST